MANIENEKMKGEDARVHSVLTMVSSTPVNPPTKTCTLSPLDRAMGQHSVSVIFYFRSGSIEFDRIRPVLNEVLTLYPNVIGRLSKDDSGNWIVKCTDAGLRVHLANVETSVDQWLRFASADDERRCLIVLQEFPDDPQFWAPFHIQVTNFEGGGTAISLSCPHMLADPISITLLIKSWTEACHDGAIIHPPFLNPYALNTPPCFTTDTTTSPSYYASKIRASDIPNPKIKMSSATFSFSDSKIKQSLTKNCSNLPDATPFDLLTALFWIRITDLKAKNHVNQLKQSISICMDMRKHLHAPLPYGYFGNAIHFSLLTVNTDNISSGDLGHVTELVHCHKTGLKEQDFWSAVDWLNSRKDDQGKFLPSFKMYGPELTFVNMETMIAPIGNPVNESQPLMYKVEFEKDQKPVHVSYRVENIEGEGLILVMPSPEEGLARRVTVTLPEDEMDKLLEDEVILSLEPTLLLSGRS